MTITDDPHTTPATPGDPAAGGPDHERIGAFIGQLLGWYTGAATTALVDIGTRAGLFDALAAGPATSAELAARAGLSERHVREWLGGMTVSGVVDHDPASGRFTFPLEHALCLTGDSSANIAPMARGVTMIAEFVPAVVRTLEEGGGIPYAAYRPDFTELQDSLNRRTYDELLVDGYLPVVPGLLDRLRAGITVADVGCGTGHVINLLARAFPASTFVGYDLGEDAIEAARAEAVAYGVANATFEVRDVASLPPAARFDLVTAFDAIHDQARPRQVLAEIRRVVADDGVFLMIDMNLSSHLEQNVGNPIAPWVYTVSLVHCMQVSLAEGGEGLGATWGRELATDLLTEAGFGSVTLADAPPQDPVNAIFVARP